MVPPALLRPNLRRERTAVAAVSRRIMFPQQTHGEALRPNNRLPLLGRKSNVRGERANIRKVLLQLILGLAFHWSPPNVVCAALGLSHSQRCEMARKCSASYLEPGLTPFRALPRLRV